MKRFSSIAFLLSVGLLAATQAGTAAPPHDCSVANSKTLFENNRVRVFSRPFDADLDLRTQLCRKSDGRHFGLATDGPEGNPRRVSQLGMRGPWLRYAKSYGGKALTTTYDACRFDVPAGRRRCEPAQVLHRIGVTSAGTLAWLSSSTDGEAVTCCGVFRLDVDGKDPVQLDSGPDIDPASFAMAAGRVYWMHGDEPRTATLP